MKKILLLLTFLLCLPTIILAHVFINPPEQYDPYWRGAFPYQRNIYWDFNQVSPVGSVGTSPGAIFEGYLDSVLNHSDYVLLNGGLRWDPQFGAIGIGGEGGQGEAIFHIDNVPVLNPVKHIYMEATVINTSGSMEGNWGAPYIFANNEYTGFTDYF
ncbi:hypothetical protein HY745_04115, partial [Candidatus Desantisbacteria bacterium]|nr:hypothetical protein [Candidatus Desantisbacteria bacterium]